MQNAAKLISDRLLDFAANVIVLAEQLDKSYTRRHIAGQLMRSATSAGANYEETCGAESKSDFVHKLQLVLKELRESLYWLQLIKKANLNRETNDVEVLLSEARELANIIAKSVITAKRGR